MILVEYISWIYWIGIYMLVILKVMWYWCDIDKFNNFFECNWYKVIV